MPYFSRQAIARPPMGRPLNTPVETFAAILFARLSGHSRKRAIEILTADPSRASGAVWSIASKAHADGCRTTEDFTRWLQGEESNQ